MEISYHLLRVLRLRGEPSSAPMSPRVIAPATVRVTGDFIICSKAPGGSFPARLAGAGAAEVGA
jgi:hypothetical protein